MWRKLGCLALVAVVLVGWASAAERQRKVLYLGIDGCRFDAMQVAKTPNLDRLIENGCYDDRTLILGDRYRGNDTISGPGWSTILTGVWADKHGVNDNEFGGKNYDAYPHLFQRLKEVQPQAFAVSVVTWDPIHEHIVRSADVDVSVAPDDGDYAGGDAAGAKRIAQALSENDPTIVFYYIGQVDETGHRYGFHPSVEPYVAAIERADALVGEVLAALEARATYDEEEWLILVTSDHGGKGTSHSNGHDVPEIRNSFVVVSGSAARRGRLEGPSYLVDVPVTALYYLGVEPLAEWQLDGRPIGLKASP